MRPRQRREEGSAEVELMGKLPRRRGTWESETRGQRTFPTDDVGEMRDMVSNCVGTGTGRELQR